jgi:hypothetical protein
MPRRRVFQTTVECSGLGDCGITSVKHSFLGRNVTFETASQPESEVAVKLDDAIVGLLDKIVGAQVASAIDRGVSFTVKITNLYQNYDDRFKPTNVTLRLKAEYFLETGQPAIEVPKAVFAAFPAPSSFFTTIAGVTHNGRQRIVARCSVGERLLLVRDPTNRYDPGAIKVMRLSGEQLGFIPAHVSRGGDPSGLASQMDRGDKYGCRIKDLTGGGEGMNLGVNIEIKYGDDEPFPDTLVALPLGQQSRDVPASSSRLGWLVVFVGLVIILAIVIFFNN